MIIYGYIIGMCIWASFCYYGTTTYEIFSPPPRYKSRWWSDKTAARYGLLSPIWPLGVIFLCLKLILKSFFFTFKTSIKVWKMAEISFPKLKENKPGQLSIVDRKNEIKK